MAYQVIFVLLWAVFGASGCATFERSKSVSPPVAHAVSTPAEQAAAPPAEAVSSAAPADSVPAAALTASEPQASIPPPRANMLPEQMGNEISDPPERSDPPSLSADNRLLEMLEKDFDVAAEQQAEARQLHFSKAIAGNPLVRHFVDYYSTTAKRYFQAVLERSGRYMPMISKVLQQEGLPEELGYLALIESEFNVHTKSPAGAAGLWQFVAPTARSYGLRVDEWVDERLDPVKSTRAAAAYLRDLHDRYGRWFLATAAYNAGPGTISKAMKSSGARDFWSLSERARLRDETRTFVPKFVAIALIASDPQSYGFEEIDYAPPLDYEVVELPRPMTLAALAAWTASEGEALRALNPALRRDSTPPGEPGFRVNVPVGKAELFFAKVEEGIRLKSVDAEPALTHEVRRGETLTSIARRYGQRVRTLMELNGLRSTKLRIGQRIKILTGGMRVLR